MFVPKGCVLLTAAVDRLAEARRTAGQANDDGKHAAQVELRAELHGGSISTKVISPSSGHTFTIRPQHWAREIALTWLEQGECLLAEDLVDPIAPELAGPGRWPELRRGERAYIFVGEHDLQRLMAKQAKQEAAPRLDVKEKPEQTRPAEPESLEPKARPTSESPQSERAKRYIQKHFPNGPGETTTAAIYGKLANDKDLKAELGGRAVPSTTVINRVLGRRKK